MDDSEPNYFVMWRPDLIALAAQGDEQAQAELNRRLAKRNAKAIDAHEQSAEDE